MLITPRFWVANRVTSRSIDLVFRVASASILSPAGRRRFLMGGIGARQLAGTLRRIHGLQSWPVAWVRTARGYLSLSRQARGRGDEREAARHEAAAALCFHFGQLFEMRDIERKRHLSRRAAALFRRASPALDPPVIPVEVPWRDIALPGCLRLPANAAGPTPMVVILNGASTVKEETIGWAAPYLRQGLAVLALDTPGSGEAWDRARGRPDHVDIADALIAFGEAHRAIDPDRISLLGISLRGAMAVQLAAANDRLAGAISLTGPFHPGAYFHHLSEVVRHEIAFVSGAEDAALHDLVDAMSLVDVAPRLRVPLLVVGAGNDLVVPPSESVSLYRAAGGRKDLLFYEDANHVAISHMGQWASASARWLRETMAG